MKIKIALVAPYSGLAELTESLKPELQQFDIQIMQGDLAEAVALLDQIHAERFDLIISRGGTARLLRKNTDLPVIDVHISAFDILRILKLVEGYQAKIEMIGFPNIIDGFKSVASLMEIDIPHTTVHDEQDVEAALQKARDNGVKVVVGDNIAVKKAPDLGMQGILITSGRESVLDAFSRAKEIYRISEDLKGRNHVYKSLLMTMDVGYALVNKRGKILFSNEAFQNYVKLSDPIDGLINEYSYFRRLLDDLESGLVLADRLMIFDPDHAFAIAGGKITGKSNEDLYYLKALPSDRTDCGIKMSYINTVESNFPQVVIMGSEFEKKKLTKHSFPLAVYGERGVGKGLFAIHLAKSLAVHQTEIEILKPTDEDFAQMIDFMTLTSDQDLLFIRGADQLSLKNQRALASRMKQLANPILFSFYEDPVLLLGDKRLSADLFEWIKGKIHFIPPIRERPDDLDEYMRTFLATYNEIYGKQIVGLRPEVTDIFHKKLWKGNLYELKKVIELFVKHSKSEYLELDILPFIQSEIDKLEYESSKNSHGSKLDLNQTLDDIEKGIIEIVLQEEDYNQTAAAKRLGINRTTLWRKLNR